MTLVGALSASLENVLAIYKCIPKALHSPATRTVTNNASYQHKTSFILVDHIKIKKSRLAV